MAVVGQLVFDQYWRGFGANDPSDEAVQFQLFEFIRQYAGRQAGYRSLQGVESLVAMSQGNNDA